MKRRLKSILPLLLIILSAAAAELLLANFAFVLYGGNAAVRNFVPDVDNYYLVERTDTQQYRSGHNEHDWKSCDGQKPSEGSNPSHCAI